MDGWHDVKQCINDNRNNADKLYWAMLYLFHYFEGAAQHNIQVDSTKMERIFRKSLE